MMEEMRRVLIEGLRTEENAYCTKQTIRDLEGFDERISTRNEIGLKQVTDPAERDKEVAFIKS